MAGTPYEQVMEDMLRGRDFAAKLQVLLRDSPEAGLLVDQILDTFARAIDAAKAMAAEEGSEVQSEVTCAGGGGGKRKAAAGGAGGRASRRRTQQSSVNTVTTSNLEDGHAWRKYGQKDIQNSKHPKAYFRCTHKYDQNCTAQRQVQLCDDAPGTYRITYIGVHTCRDPATIAPVVVHQVAAAGSDVLPAGSRLISFAPNASGTTTSATTTGNTTNQLRADHQEGASLRSPGSGLPPLKLEGSVDQEEVLSSLTPAGSARNPLATTPGPDQGDVTSGLHYFGGGVDDMCYDDTFDLEDIFRY